MKKQHNPYNYITSLQNESSLNFRFFRIDDSENDLQNLNIVKVFHDEFGDSIYLLVKQIPKSNPNCHIEAKSFISEQTNINKNSVLVGYKKEINKILIEDKFLVNENDVSDKVSNIINNNSNGSIEHRSN